ncbi:Activity-regulated cytoskeleton-associated protein [Bienertia sinuspersici]
MCLNSSLRTNDPRFHLKGFRATMTIKGVNPIFYPKVFRLSLDLVCQNWFFSLSDKDIATWEDITHAFMTRYKGNTQASTSLRELEILKKTKKEGFTAYLTRWKDVVAQMVNTPSEKEMVKIFVSNLLPKYCNHLRYLGFETFDKFYHIEIETENDLLKANDNNNNGNNNNKGKWGVNTMETTRALARRPRCEYAPLGMTYTQAFDCLKSKGVLSPIGPTADPPAERRSPKWTLTNNANTIKLPIPPGGKKPNTETSPLTVLMIDAKEVPFDLVDYITPVGKELPPIPELPNYDQINNIGDENEDNRLSQILFAIAEALDSLDARMEHAPCREAEAATTAKVPVYPTCC